MTKTMTKTKKPKMDKRRPLILHRPKFIQIQSIDSPAGTKAKWFVALDESGTIYIYLGYRKGWKRLNMHRMSPLEEARDNRAFERKIKGFSPTTPDDWNPEWDTEVRWDRED